MIKTIVVRICDRCKRELPEGEVMHQQMHNGRSYDLCTADKEEFDGLVNAVTDFLKDAPPQSSFNPDMFKPPVPFLNYPPGARPLTRALLNHQVHTVQDGDPAPDPYASLGSWGCQ